MESCGHFYPRGGIWFFTFFLAVPGECQPAGTQGKPRALLVVAHPDDEYEMAGTVYHLAKELSGRIDQLIITDGEAGFHYSLLAERYYGLKLTDEADGRKELPHIRREEARRSARILGIDHQWFLNQKDDRFTLDADEVLQKSWNRQHVLSVILARLRQGHYDYVFVLLPIADTHGAHKAASILTLQAVEQLPPGDRGRSPKSPFAFAPLRPALYQPKFLRCVEDFLLPILTFRG